MTEQSKIPLPPDDGEPAKEASLLERASGAFGLGGFRAAPMPETLEEPAIKRARAAKQVKPRAPGVIPEPASVPARDSVAPSGRPAIIVREKEAEAVHFSGTKHQVDRNHLRQLGLLVPENGVSGLLEEFRIVKRKLLSAANQRGTAKDRRVLICSPHPGEGKTFCAVNLAIAMANERDSEVLLIDADFAKPSILSNLGLPKGPGFMDALANPALKPEELAIGTDIPGLWVLPAGNMTNADSEYLASGRTAEVLDRLTLGAPNQILIFDSPPALAASPAAELAKHVGQAVLVVRADSTGQSALEDAVELLSACDDIKLLLNAAHFSPSGRKFGTYYGYEG